MATILLQRKIAEDVRNHGATGDGVTDDRAALQAAIDAAPAGSMVFFPKGSYKVSGKLNITKSLWLVGAGWESKIWTATIGAGVMHVFGTNNVVIRDLHMGAEGTSGADAILHLESCPSIYVDKCALSGGGPSLKLSNISESVISDSIIETTFASPGCIVRNVQKVRITGCTFSGNRGGAGLHVTDGMTGVNGTGKLVIDGNFFSQNEQEGVRVSAGMFVSIIGNTFNDNSSALNNGYSALFIDGSVTRAILLGNIIQDDTATPDNKFGIELGPSTTRCTVIGNVVDPNSAVSGRYAFNGSSHAIGLNDAQDLYVEGQRLITDGRQITHAVGLSATGTAPNNLRGSATFATAGTVAVTFATAEPDATYYVQLTGGANETFWVTGKATTGFTINSSNASSTATVDWLLVR